MPRHTSSQEFNSVTHVAAIAQLPPEVLVQLLEKLDQQQLGITSLVCTSWRNASLVALKRLKLYIPSHRQASLLPYWLNSRAQHLQHLELQHYSQTAEEVQLPLGNAAQLCRLHLYGGLLMSNVNLTLPSLKHSLTALDISTAAANEQLLSSIAVLTNLHSLSLHQMKWASLTAARRKWQLLASSIWSNLLQLTSLSATCCGLDDQAMQHITRLSNLRYMDLDTNQIRDAKMLQPLPSSLTYLSIGINHKEFDCSDILGRDCQWQLQHLAIPRLRMSNSGQLSALTKLTYLEAYWLNTPDNAQLLAVLPQLQHLQHLDLCGIFGHDSQMADIQQWNAALQLPHLTYLDFSNNMIAVPTGASSQSVPPPLAVSLAFFSDSYVPKLQALMLGCRGTTVDVQHYYKNDDFVMLVAKCPDLDHLDLMGRIHEDSRAKDLQPLQQLSCLTAFSVGGGYGQGRFVVTDDAVRLLATLTILEHLDVYAASAVTDLGLMSLTKLTRLTELQMEGVNSKYVGSHFMDANSDISLSTNTEPPDVWQQLYKRCAQSAVCLQEIVKGLERDLKAAKQGTVQPLLNRLFGDWLLVKNTQ